jgi:hypothetical protein
MVHDLDLHMFLWAKSCSTMAYIMKKCPHRGRTRHQRNLSLVRNPKGSHFHVFMCVVYFHIPRKKELSLNPPVWKVCLLATMSPPRLRVHFVPTKDTSEQRCEVWWRCMVLKVLKASSRNWGGRNTSFPNCWSAKIRNYIIRSAGFNTFQFG